jgi:putative transposase
MPRPLRQIEAGLVYHVLNRGNGRRTLFSKENDFLSFIKILAEGVEQFEVDLFSYCLMSNHWHLLVRPRKGQALSRFMAWVTVTHARRHHMHYPKPGSGHLYQGRFKSFPVESDDHYLTVARYIHANPLRAGLVKRAEAWRWTDLHGHSDLRLTEWPVNRPPRWARLVNSPQPEDEVAAMEQSLSRGTPLGSDAWVKRIAQKLNLASTLAPLGRPRKAPADLTPKYRKQLERMAEKSG